MSLPTITLEDHFMATSIGEEYGLNEVYANRGMSPEWMKRLADLGTDGPRIQEMNGPGHVTLQIVSHTPGGCSADPSLCRAANDELAAAIKRQPDRLAGFAMLPMLHPEEAAAELERCVTDLGLVGALVDSHNKAGEFYDGDKFWVLFAKAEELDVPLYLHPAFPTPEMIKVLYQGNYPQVSAATLGGAGLGWHQNVALHVMRLFAARVFDEYPKLKIIIGHNGEMLPFQLERSNFISKRLALKSDGGRRVKTLQEMWDENIWLTTSGMFSVNPLATILRNTKIDRILYSVDWPFAENAWGWEFLQELKESGLLTEGELEMIAYKNAEKLLRVKVKQ